MTLSKANTRPVLVRFPNSTYRLQLNAGLTFNDAAKVARYVNRLGASELYLSPSFKAAPGSPHGYDICDHQQLNPELGGEAEFRALALCLCAYDMGILLDFVPNHMGADPMANPWWRDVLENGPSSPYARFFDVDWHPVKTELLNKVLLPVLGDHYGRVLERGELRIRFDAGAFVLNYFEHQFPLNPRQMVPTLSRDLDSLKSVLGADAIEVREFQSVISSLHYLPAYTETDPSRIEERHREKEVAKERLRRLANDSIVIRKHIEHNVAWVNGVVGEPSSFDPLHTVLEAQAYRLAYWRTSLHEINYRRFFDINGLVGVRVEDPVVFEEVHKGLLNLVRDGLVTGVRLDHIDGLLDPEGYLRRLNESLCGEGKKSIYVVAEKILSSGEEISRKFLLQGTTGYDFLNDLNGLFVDGQGALPLKNFHAQFTGRSMPIADAVYEAKSFIAATSLASELAVLANAIDKLSEKDRRTRDFTLISLQDALREVSACVPVYRTYFGWTGIDEFDRHVIEQALSEARRRNPTTEGTVWEFLRDVLLTNPQSDLPQAILDERRAFALKWQQYTGPLQAKGLEDTVFYRHNVLLSLNEVGGEPYRFGVSVRAFHSANQHRAEHWPLSMLATSTHDTKRGEDARCRINVISEIAGEWEERVTQWAKINAEAKSKVAGEMAPDRGDEYMFYQALLGAWPASAADGEIPADFVPRMQRYMQKALREAKLHSSWVNNNEAYENAANLFVETVLSPATGKRFLQSFQPFCERVAFWGMLNSISQVVLKLVAPGVPDFYQGCEMWNLSLADPDNRAAVDFAELERSLLAMEPYLGDEGSVGSRRTYISGMLHSWRDGRIKQFITAAGLRLRRREKEVFLQGNYLPLEIEGRHASRTVAFCRRFENSIVMAVASRLCAGLSEGDLAVPVGDSVWQDTRIILPAELAQVRWKNELTGEPLAQSRDGAKPGLSMASVLEYLPVAILSGKIATENSL